MTLFRPVKRRAALTALLAAWPAAALGFGQQGAFHPRLLTVAGGPELPSDRVAGLAQWSWELVRRTSAPARLHPDRVAADDPKLLTEPFCVWAGRSEVAPLAATELRGLRQFFELGGVLFVDDCDPVVGAFGRGARAELARVLPEVPLLPLSDKHVVYKSYYLVERPVGRVQGPPTLDAMIRGKRMQVLFSSHDLLGALARDDDGAYQLPLDGGDVAVRQQAMRLAVNIAMYVLCSDYKDDQVHAEELMRRRGRLQ